MEPHQQSNLPRSPLPLHNISPAHTSQLLQRTANSTPVSSPGLFSPTASRLNMSLLPHPVSEGTTPAPTPPTAGSKNNLQSPYLHPLQTRKVRETFTANVDRDYATGRKYINQYEVRQEIGRGQHGKVKLAYNTHSEENVAIKIIPRFSKKRRLGKVTAEDPQRNTKREIAILKKIRHPNVVALLEVIDDPELKKIYMVLEHVELGEITWRKKGLPTICHLERRLWERGQRGESLSAEEEEYLRQLQRKQAKKDQLRALAKQRQQEDPNNTPHNWSLEYGAFEDDDMEVPARLPPLGKSPSTAGSRVVSQAPSRTQSARSLSRNPTPFHPSETDLQSLKAEADELEYPTPIRPGNVTASALDGTMFGPYADDISVAAARARSPSMADSIISHMSSMDFGASQPHDPFADDFSYVPCFTFDAARRAFRDTVLGLEYLHYNGVVHRDIKPANLLWTKDFRVKISDFGVSYFGRPVRDGEPVESVPEAEAHDFDDDRELAKTVGTPAFFAPELCYTDLDQEQPKVTEQIDVWSLGVTLYCIIFARIPFLAEDEFLMFRMIATEDVYIPRRRLRPVSPFTDPTKTSLFNREGGEPYRDDEDPSYEDVDEDLYDLLSRMLEKDPQKRIRLSEVKSHPWLLRDITNILNWMDETDPSHELSGRQIEVDEREIGGAVVPITFLERARSAVKKVVRQVIHHHRSEKGEGSSRRRATSSVGSSGGDSMSSSAAVVANPRDARRKSLRGDDHFATITQMPTGDHPLSQSVTHTPQDSPSAGSPATSLLASRRAARVSSGLGQETSDDFEKQDPPSSAVPPKPLPRHVHSRSALLSLNCGFHESHTSPPTPRTGDARTGRETDMSPDPVVPRTRSMDRAGIIFASPDKHARPSVGVNTTVISGRVQQPPRSPRPVRSVDLGAALNGSGKYSPSFFPRLASQYLNGHPKSETNIQDKRRSMVELEERPTTAHRIESRPTGDSVPLASSYPGQSFREASSAVPIQGRHQSEQQQRHEQNLAIRTSVSSNPARGRAASSPNGEFDETAMGHRHVPSRDATMSTAVSSSYTSMGAIAGTPMTSPSVVTSPGCIMAGSAPPSREAHDSVAAMLAFQSDPSLPALLSGASSVSADVEGDFLGNPGVVDDRTTSLIGTTDSLTPPAPAKESMSEFPLEGHDMDNADAIAVRLDSARDTPRGATSSMARPPAIRASSSHGDSYGDSDSDDGLVMLSKKKGVRSPTSVPSPSASHLQQPTQQYQHVGTLANAARRRDTNTSIGSTETAKKIDVHSDNTAPASAFNVARTDC